MLEAGSLAAGTAPTPKDCGSCTLCCTLMRVAMDPPKPERTACQHCTDRGCEIYADRPDVCAGFKCVWLATRTLPGLDPLPAAMRPDRSGVVLDLNSAGTIIAHSDRAASWRREPMLSWLLQYARRGPVILELPSGAQQLTADGHVWDLVRVGVDPESNNRLYVRASDLEKHIAETAR